MKINKKWVSLLDVVLSMMIMWFLTLVYYGWLKAYYKYTTRAENASYSNFALTECAEVVHSFRYWEWDKVGSTWWENYITKYPTWLYKMTYDEPTRVWNLLPIYKDINTQEQYVNFRDMLTETWYTVDTEGENFLVWPKNIPIRRYVFINNTIADKSIVQCYVKFYDPFFIKNPWNDANDFYNYEELKFIMTNYM